MMTRRRRIPNRRRPRRRTSYRRRRTPTMTTATSETFGGEEFERERNSVCGFGHGLFLWVWVWHLPLSLTLSLSLLCVKSSGFLFVCIDVLIWFFFYSLICAFFNYIFIYYFRNGLWVSESVCVCEMWLCVWQGRVWKMVIFYPFYFYLYWRFI